MHVRWWRRERAVGGGTSGYRWGTTVDIRLEAGDFGLRTEVWTMKHGCLLNLARRAVLHVPPMLDSKALLEIAMNPHLSDDVSVLGEV